MVVATSAVATAQFFARILGVRNALALELFLGYTRTLPLWDNEDVFPFW